MEPYIMVTRASTLVFHYKILGHFKENKRHGLGYFYNPRERKYYQQVYEEDRLVENQEIPCPPKEH